MNRQFLPNTLKSFKATTNGWTLLDPNERAAGSIWRSLVHQLDHANDNDTTSDTTRAESSLIERVVNKWSECRSLGAKILRNGHKVLMRGESGSGEFRGNGICEVRCRHTGAVIYTPPPANKVMPLVDDLFDFVSTNPSPPVLKAFVVLLQLLLIHPFKDGNGRCARALFAAICVRADIRHPAALLALMRMYGDGATRLHAGSAVLRATGSWQVYLDDCRQSLEESIAQFSVVTQ